MVLQEHSGDLCATQSLALTWPSFILDSRPIPECVTSDNNVSL